MRSSLGRVRGPELDVGCFTNLPTTTSTSTHDLDGYLAAKARLFDRLSRVGAPCSTSTTRAVRRLAARLPGRASTFGAGGAVAPTRDSTAAARRRPRRARDAARARSPSSRALLGRYNLPTCSPPWPSREALELPPPAIAEGLALPPPLPGRMQPVRRGQGFPVMIDYAHTDAALERRSRALRALAGGA